MQYGWALLLDQVAYYFLLRQPVEQFLTAVLNADGGSKENAKLAVPAVEVCEGAHGDEDLRAALTMTHVRQLLLARFLHDEFPKRRLIVESKLMKAELLIFLLLAFNVIQRLVLVVDVEELVLEAVPIAT